MYIQKYLEYSFNFHNCKCQETFNKMDFIKITDLCYSASCFKTVETELFNM